MLIPIRNFGVLIENSLFRSAQPTFGYEFNWLKETLKIEHIVNLREEMHIDDKLAPVHGIKVHNFDVADHKPPTIKQAHDFIKLINRVNRPLLFHCEHGHGRTSTFAVIARIGQGWTLQQALEEEEKEFNYTFKHKSQLDWLIEAEKKLKRLL